jgi:uncharacterized protein YegP (UPF0339 family)
MPAEPKFEVYKDNAGKFSWRLRASNDEEIASGQGYESKEGCMKGDVGASRFPDARRLFSSLRKEHPPQREHSSRYVGALTSQFLRLTYSIRLWIESSSP